MRVDDGERVALVLDEPQLRVDLHLEAVRRRERVAPGLEALGDAVAQEEQPARLVR